MNPEFVFILLCRKFLWAFVFLRIFADKKIETYQYETKIGRE